MASRDDIKAYLTTQAATLLAAFSDSASYGGQAARLRPERLDARVAYASDVPVRRKGRLTRHYLTITLAIHGRDKSAEDTLTDTLEGAARAVHAGLDGAVGGANGAMPNVTVERLRCWAPEKPQVRSVRLREQILRVELDEWEA